MKKTKNEIVLIEEPLDIYLLNRGEDVEVIKTHEYYDGIWTCAEPEVPLSEDYIVSRFIREVNCLTNF